MKIKVILLLMAVAAMSSCHSDDDEEDVTYYTNYGYFEGNVDDSYVYICNTKDDRDRIGMSYREYYNELEIVTWGVRFNPSPSSSSFLRIRLCSLHRGDYLMKKTLSEVKHEPLVNKLVSSAVDYEVKCDGESVLYGPKRETPFLVYVTDVRYDPRDKTYESLVEGYMNGVLYNRENPSDSIVFDHVRFGFH